MRKLPVIIACFLFPCAIGGTTLPDVNATAPIGRILYEQKGDEVILNLELQDAGGIVSRCNSLLFVVGELSITADNGKSTLISAEPINQASPLSRRYKIRIGKGQPLDSDWQAMTYSFSYRCSQPRSLFSAWTQSPEFSIVRTVEDLSLRALTLRAPDWYFGRPPLLPLMASDDVRVEVVMKESNGVDVAAGSGFLKQGEWDTIELVPLQGRSVALDRQYVFEAIARRSGQVFASQRLDWFSNKPIQPFVVLPEPSQKELRVTEADKPYELAIGTSEGGQIRAVFEKTFRMDSPPAMITGKRSEDGRHHAITLDLRGVEDGFYPFHFEGKSDAGRNLLNSDKKFVLDKNTVTTLSAPVAFRMDDKGVLQVEYSLSRSIPNALRIDKYNIQIVAESVAGNPGGGGAHYRVAIDTTKADQFRPFEDAVKQPGTKRAPVDFSIISLAGDRPPGEAILSFQLEAVRLDEATVTRKLAQASDELESKSPDMNKAKEAVKTALGINKEAGKETDSEKQAIDYVFSILQAKDKPKKMKFLTVLKFAARVAATYFGVPVA